MALTLVDSLSLSEVLVVGYWQGIFTQGSILPPTTSLLYHLRILILLHVKTTSVVNVLNCYWISPTVKLEVKLECPPSVDFL